MTVTFVNPQPSPSSPPQEPILLSLKGTPSPIGYDTTEGAAVKGTMKIVRFSGYKKFNTGVWANVDYPVDSEIIFVPVKYLYPEDQEQPVTPTRHFEGIPPVPHSSGRCRCKKRPEVTPHRVDLLWKNAPRPAVNHRACVVPPVISRAFLRPERDAVFPPCQ